MLKTQIAQQATPLSTPSGRLPRKHELSLREQCNVIILRGSKQLEGPKGVCQD